MYGSACYLHALAPCTLWPSTLNTERTEHLRGLSVEALHVLSISAIAEVTGPARDQLYRTGERDLLPFGPGYIEGSRERPHLDFPTGQPVQDAGDDRRARPGA